MRYHPNLPRALTCLLLTVLSAGIWLGALQATTAAPSAVPEATTRAAAQAMAKATEVIRAWRREHGVAIDATADPNGTGWIGLETSPITTDEGSLPAKRSTTNPNCAAAIVQMLTEAGVRAGDVVALGMSGSFPALNAASIIAVEKVGATPITISSIGASQWGANDPRLTWPDMEKLLFEAGVVHHRSVAVAPGGTSVGLSLPEPEQAFIHEVAKRTKLRLIEKGSGRPNLHARMRIYRRHATGRPLKLFLNVGGALANIGPHAALPEGLLLPGTSQSTKPARGLAGRMLRHGTPVINLRHIRALCRAYHLPWDPNPLPAPGASLRPSQRTLPPWRAGVLLALLLAGGVGLLARDARDRARRYAVQEEAAPPARAAVGQVEE